MITLNVITPSDIFSSLTNSSLHTSTKWQCTIRLKHGDTTRKLGRAWGFMIRLRTWSGTGWPALSGIHCRIRLWLHQSGRILVQLICSYLYWHDNMPRTKAVRVFSAPHHPSHSNQEIRTPRIKQWDTSKNTMLGIRHCWLVFGLETRIPSNHALGSCTVALRLTRLLFASSKRERWRRCYPLADT